MRHWAPRDNGPSRVKNMTGKRVGMLTVGTAAPALAGRARWHCKCDCGNDVIVRGDILRRAIKDNAKSSCGCYHATPFRKAPVEEGPQP